MSDRALKEVHALKHHCPLAFNHPLKPTNFDICCGSRTETHLVVTWALGIYSLKELSCLESWLSAFPSLHKHCCCFWLSRAWLLLSSPLLSVSTNSTVNMPAFAESDRTGTTGLRFPTTGIAGVHPISPATLSRTGHWGALERRQCSSSYLANQMWRRDRTMCSILQYWSTAKCVWVYIWVWWV